MPVWATPSGEVKSGIAVRQRSATRRAIAADMLIMVAPTRLSAGNIRLNHGKKWIDGEINSIRGGWRKLPLFVFLI